MIIGEVIFTAGAVTKKPAQAVDWTVYRRRLLNAHGCACFYIFCTCFICRATLCVIQGGGKILRFSTEISVYLGNGTR